MGVCLFSLPYNVRSEIWSYIFDGSVLRTHCSDYDRHNLSPPEAHKTTTPFRACRDDSHFPWQITATCRQLRAECTPLLSRATMYWHDFYTPGGAESELLWQWCVPSGYREHITRARVSGWSVTFDVTLFPALEVVQVAGVGATQQHYVKNAEDIHDLMPVHDGASAGWIVRCAMRGWGETVKVAWEPRRRQRAGLAVQRPLRVHLVFSIQVRAVHGEMAASFMRDGDSQKPDSAYSVLRRHDGGGVIFTMVCDIDDDGARESMDELRRAYAHLTENVLPASDLLENIGSLSREEAMKLAGILDRATRLPLLDLRWLIWPVEGSPAPILCIPPRSNGRTEVENRKTFFTDDFMHRLMAK